MDASLAQLCVPDLLHHEIPSKAARRLDDNRSHTVALDPFEHGCEARACVDGISTANGRIIELRHQLIASARDSP